MITGIRPLGHGSRQHGYVLRVHSRADVGIVFQFHRPWAWAGWRLDLRGARHFYISYLANTPTAALPVCAYCSALSHRIQYHRKLRHGPPRLSRASWRGAPASASARARFALRRRKGPPPAVLQNSEIDLFTHNPFASRPQTHSHGAPFGGALRARLLGLWDSTALQ